MTDAHNLREAAPTLKAIRKWCGLSAGAMAEEMGISRRQVQRLESKERVKHSTYRRHLAAAKAILERRIAAVDKMQ